MLAEKKDVSDFEHFLKEIDFTSAAVVTLTLGKTKRSVVTSVGAWPPITADAALPPLLTDEGLLQEPVAAAPAATAALTKKFASSICKGK